MEKNMHGKKSKDSIKFWGRGLTLDEIVTERKRLEQITSRPPEHLECEIRFIDAANPDLYKVTECKPHYGSDHGGYIMLREYTYARKGNKVIRVQK